MISPVDIRPDHLEIVQDILIKNLPAGIKVWVFGSRANWTTKDSSDLDLALEGEGKLSHKVLGALKDAFEDSSLPYTVDVVDFNRIGDAFKQIVELQQMPLPPISRSLAMAGECSNYRFGMLLSEPVRNGLYKNKEFHGRGAKVVNMGELFAYPRLRAVPMKRIEVTDSEASRFQIKSGDLLFARRSLVAEGAGKCCVVLDVDEPTVFESSIIRARPNERKADSLYLFYFFNSPLGLHLLGTIRRQVAVAGITGSDLANLEISLPPRPEQRAIAHILGTLDDKIELNRRMNETLEGIARALFKSWFVDFDPVRAKMEGRDTGLPPHIAELFPDRLVPSELGEIPAGWEVVNVSELCGRIENGGTPKRSNARFWNGSIDWFKTGELGDGPLLFSEEKITHEGLAGSSCKLWPSGTILIALYASPTVGRLGILETPATANQACSALVANPSVGHMFVYYSLLNSRDRLQRIAVGAAQQNISQKIVKEHQVVRPSLDVLKVFQDLIFPAHDRKAAGIRESDVLGRIRDALLPKLISGELRLRDTETFLEGAL